MWRRLVRTKDSERDTLQVELERSGDNLLSSAGRRTGWRIHGCRLRSKRHLPSRPTIETCSVAPPQRQRALATCAAHDVLVSGLPVAPGRETPQRGPQKTGCDMARVIDVTDQLGELWTERRPIFVRHIVVLQPDGLETIAVCGRPAVSPLRPPRVEGTGRATAERECSHCQAKLAGVQVNQVAGRWMAPHASSLDKYREAETPERRKGRVDQRQETVAMLAVQRSKPLPDPWAQTEPDGSEGS